MLTFKPSSWGPSLISQDQRLLLRLESTMSSKASSISSRERVACSMVRLDNLEHLDDSISLNACHLEIDHAFLLELCVQHRLTAATGAAQRRALDPDALRPFHSSIDIHLGSC